MAQQTILGRVSQLARANINAILDSVEDPEKQLDQMVRDYTNAIGEARAAVGQTVGELRLTEEDRDEAVAAAAEWGRKAKQAARAADSAETSDSAARYDNLARIALEKQLNYERQGESLKAKAEADTVTVNGLKDGLLKMEAKLETLRSKRSELLSRAKMAKAQETVNSALGSVDAFDPTSELSRFEDRIRTQEARVRGQAELQGESLDAQFEALEDEGDNAEVERRLAELKQKDLV